MIRVFLAAIAVLALAACTSPGSVPADAPTATPPAAPTSEASTPPEPTPAPTTSQPAPAPGYKKTAMLRVTTDGPASVTVAQNDSVVREDISGPWEKTIEVTESPTELSLTVEADPEAGTVGCEIKAAGAEISNMSRGASVTATCSTTIP